MVCVLSPVVVAASGVCCCNRLVVAWFSLACALNAIARPIAMSNALPVMILFAPLLPVLVTRVKRSSRHQFREPDVRRT